MRTKSAPRGNGVEVPHVAAVEVPMSKPSKNTRLKRKLWEEVHGRAVTLPVKCHWCGCMVAFEQATVDHVRARSEGGRDDLSNVVVACDDCNQRRNMWNQSGIW